MRAQCIAIFGLGGALAEDDAAAAGFFASRMALTGKAVAEMLRAVLPRFGVMVGEKALAQATPPLGALAGGVINPLFAGHYRALAHVHFRLRALERDHDPDRVRACFERLLAARREGGARALARGSDPGLIEPRSAAPKSGPGCRITPADPALLLAERPVPL